MNDHWRPGRMVLWIWTWFGIRARLGLHLFRLCRLRTGRCIGFYSGHRLIILMHVLVYGSREDSLLSCHRFRLFLDQLIGGGDGGGLSTTLSLGLKCGGLESKFGRGPGPLDRRVVGWSYLCLGYKRDVCFRVSNWATLIHESPCNTVRLDYDLAL